MKSTFTIAFILFLTIANAQKKFDQLAESNAIRSVLAQQVNDWNAFSNRKWLGFGLTAMAMALHLRENHLQITYYMALIVA
ncbi:MAG: hypothetical protein ACKOC0_10920, partial [Cytophagales bacterium]